MNTGGRVHLGRLALLVLGLAFMASVALGVAGITAVLMLAGYH